MTITQPSQAPVLTRDRGYETALWPTAVEVKDAVDAFRPVVSACKSASGSEIMFVAPSGYAERSDEVQPWLDKLSHSPETVAMFRVECVVKGIGAVALAYHRGIPGMTGKESNAISVQAESVDHECLRGLFRATATCAAQEYGFPVQD